MIIFRYQPSTSELNKNINLTIDTMLWTSSNINGSRYYGTWDNSNSGIMFNNKTVTPGFILYLIYNSVFSGQLNFKFYAA